jgi:hypothetical protein
MPIFFSWLTTFPAKRGVGNFDFFLSKFLSNPLKIKRISAWKKLDKESKGRN